MLKQQNEITEAQKKVIASLIHPRLRFAPKSAEQLAVERKAAEEEIKQEQAEAIANAKIGDKMPDGSIYAGISPDTKQPMYVTAKDASTSMNFNKAAKYSSTLDVHGHQDWHVPTKEELNVLFQNRKKGALKGTFNLTGSYPSGWYWSSTSNFTINGWCQRFSDGGQYGNFRFLASSVRCVR